MPKIVTTPTIVWRVDPSIDGATMLTGKLFLAGAVVGELSVLHQSIPQLVPELRQLGVEIDVMSASYLPDQHKTDAFIKASRKKRA